MRIIAPVLLYVGVAALCIGLAIVPSCSGTNCKGPENSASPGCVAQDAVVTCAGGSPEGAVVKYGPEVAGLIENAPRLPDGSVNWPAIEVQLEDAAAKYGGCVLADVFAQITSRVFKVGSAGAGSSSAPRIPPGGAKEAFEKLRASKLGGKRFATPHGEI